MYYKAGIRIEKVENTMYFRKKITMYFIPDSEYNFNISIQSTARYQSALRKKRQLHKYTMF